MRPGNDRVSSRRVAPAWLARLFNPRTDDDAAPDTPGSGDPAAVELPTPLTVQRVADDLTRRGYKFKIDPDGDVTGTWDGNRFWFLLLGEHREILQIRGRWAGNLSASSRLSVLQATNDWNRERIWPKVYARSESLGLTLYSEVSVDFEHGATDDQLAQTVSCGLVTAAQFFASVSALTPPEISDDAR